MKSLGKEKLANSLYKNWKEDETSLPMQCKI